MLLNVCSTNWEDIHSSYQITSLFTFEHLYRSYLIFLSPVIITQYIYIQMRPFRLNELWFIAASKWFQCESSHSITHSTLRMVISLVNTSGQNSMWKKESEMANIKRNSPNKTIHWIKYTIWIGIQFAMSAKKNAKEECVYSYISHTTKWTKTDIVWQFAGDHFE